MRRGVLLLLVSCAPLLVGCAGGSLPRSLRLDAGRLGSVRVIGKAEATVGLVILFSSRTGWDADAERAAGLLAELNVVVVGVDLGEYLAGLARSDDGCHYVVAELEELSKGIQHDEDFPRYRTPVLAGIRAGGTLAYAALAQSPAATLAGAAAIDPAPSLETRVPLCAGATSAPVVGGGYRYDAGTRLPGWWDVNGRGGGDAAERLVALVRPHLRATAEAEAPGLRELPLVEYPVESPSRVMAIIYSGDGGWRDLDKQIGEALAAAGTPVIGVDVLRYFWHRKSPERVAADLATIIREYSARWGASQVVLVGYSFGADILPFAVNRMPDDVRPSIRQLSLLGLEPTAAFEFSVAGWFGAGEEESPVLPELLCIDPRLVQCFYGDAEDDSLCRDPALRGVEIVRTGGGHHFDGDYDALAGRILDGLHRRVE